MPDAIAKDDVDTLALEIKRTMTRQEEYLPRLPAPDSAAPLAPFGQISPPAPEIAQPLVAQPAGASDALSVR
jgi:hypothetical protein